ncbi:unnamed protein product [Anisakis simplex]|uniref:PI-PLC Y-box domain-containing protein n=1 Tax=Anisakis simplex TaxID=6269 RepID=A0A3P6P9Z0_ANISI|nr:unnamed protein product [Anisakis simplex]
MNYQTPGLMMDLQEGKFSENGGCGYLLKPSMMRDDLFTPGDKLPFAPQVSSHSFTSSEPTNIEL